MLHIYDSLSKEKKIFKPIVPGQIGMYVCGITVYDLCHVGHGRTFISFDTIYRWLKHSDYDVKYVRNITDIDDKIIKRSAELGITTDELVAKFTKEMHADFDRLNLLSPTVEPKATDYIQQMIQICNQLVEKGLAYQAESGDLLFRVDAYPNYSQLSKQKIEQLLDNNSSVVNADSKASNLDFVLWKISKAGEPAWESPWGLGRPGWHIECSAMSLKELGEHFDIHGGGSDLIFPHHENEMAQSCGCSGKKFVNFWLHSGMIMVNNEKMSKSLGNFFTLRTLLEAYHPEVVRLFFISSHYRSQSIYSIENLDNAKNNLDRIYTALRRYNFALLNRAITQNTDIIQIAKDFVQEFSQAMNDDFNTPKALAAVYDLVGQVNKFDADSEEGMFLANYLVKYCQILGLLNHQPNIYFQGSLDEDLETEVLQLIEQRNSARKNKDWTLADQVRDRLKELNIELDDTSNGTIWKRFK